MHVCRMLWVHTNVRIGIVHTCWHASVFCPSFCSSVRCFYLSVCASYGCIKKISLCSSFYLPSVYLSDIPSIRLSVCMFTCTYVETNVLVYDTLSGFSLHWTLISLGCFSCRVSNDGIAVCKNCAYDRQKIHIYL